MSPTRLQGYQHASTMKNILVLSDERRVVLKYIMLKIRVIEFPREISAAQYS